MDLPADARRAADLRRIKALAVAMLLLALALLVAARLMQPAHPAFGFVAAFAEAAMIGGLADWYAVVALFRRPLGLPIPHTAIIQQNQERIADKLGEFIERQFLSEKAVDERLRRIDFAAFISTWLDDPKRAESLSRFVLQLAPDALSAIEQSGLKRFLARRIQNELASVDLAPLAASSLRAFIASGRHQELFDELLAAFHRALNDPQMLAAIGERIRNEMPTLLRLYRADRYVLNRIVASATAFFEEVRADPQHAFRIEFDRMAGNLADRLGSDPALAMRIAGLQQEVLARPEWTRIANTLWAGLVRLIRESAGGEGVHPHLTRLFIQVGRHLAGDLEMRGEINEGVLVVARRLIADHKSEVAVFISDQVKGWDIGQLVDVIELNVGRDLQYIRFNGMLIGGLAGLALHTLEVVLRIG